MRKGLLVVLLTLAAVLAISAAACSETAKANVTLNQETLQLVVGGSAVLEAEIEGTDELAVWESSDTDAVTVIADEDGLTATVRAVAKGEATVTVTAGGASAACVVTVTEGTTQPSKGTLTAGDLTYAIPASDVYDGSEQGIGQVTAPTGAGAVTVKYDGAAGLPVNAGIYAVTADVAEGDGYDAASGLALGDYTIAQAAGSWVAPSAVSVTYESGLTLGDITPPTDYVWDEELTTPVDAGDGQEFSAVYTDPSGNYTAASGTVTINVAKAAGSWVAPSAVSVTYTSGLTLGDITLPTDYAWDEELSTPVNAGSGQTFDALYTDPSGNYEAASGMITVNVAKAAGSFVSTSALSAVLAAGLTLDDIALPSSAYAWVTASTPVTTAGDGQTFAATYTDPSGNYTAASGNITVHVAAADEFQSFNSAYGLTGMKVTQNAHLTQYSFDPGVSYDGNGSLKIESSNSWFELYGVLPRQGVPSGATKVTFMVKYEVAGAVKNPVADRLFQLNYFTTNSSGTRGDWLGDTGARFNALSGDWVKCEFNIGANDLQYGIDFFIGGINSVPTWDDHSESNTITIWIDDIRYISADKAVSVSLSENAGVYTINATAAGEASPEFIYRVYQNGVPFAMDSANTFTPDGSSGLYKAMASLRNEGLFGHGEAVLRGAPGADEYECFDCVESIAGMNLKERPDLTQYSFDENVSYDGNGSLKITSSHSWFELFGVLPRQSVPSGATKVAFMVKYEVTGISSMDSAKDRLFQLNYFTTTSTGTRGSWLGDSGTKFTALSGDWIKCEFNIGANDLQYGIDFFLTGINSVPTWSDNSSSNNITIWIDDIRFV